MVGLKGFFHMKSFLLKMKNDRRGVYSSYSPRKDMLYAFFSLLGMLVCALYVFFKAI
jgi:hypothetical protein